MRPGQTFTASATIRGGAGAATLSVPDGWTVSAPVTGGPQPGGWTRVNWQVTAPATLNGSAFVLKATAGDGSDARVMRAIPAAPPSGTLNVSDLPFLSATNGWGPVDRTYEASTTATVTSTAGDAALTADGGRLSNGAFTLSEPLQIAFSKSNWSAPVSNDGVTVAFKQHIGATEPLRTGIYSRTVTFTLSTTTP